MEFVSTSDIVVATIITELSWSKSFCQSHKKNEPPLSKLSAVDHLENNFSSDDLLCSTDEIVQLTQGLDVSKTNSLDGVSAHMLKATCSSITPSLTKLFNLSISKGQFPISWKVARVVTIPKSPLAKNSPSGYRPISLLSIPYSGKYSRVLIFAVLGDQDETAKFFTANFF